MSWEDNVRKVVPYIPGEQPRDDHKVIKLNTNEMPYPPSPKVTEALTAFDAASLRLYPAPDVGPLRDALADRYGVGTDEMFVGVGSDDVLATAFLTFFYSDKPVIFPDITYSFYDVWCDVYRIPYETKKLDDDFHIRKEDYLCENGGIVIANPNAPTGISEEKDISFIEDIVKANAGSVVIVDEAYVDFGGVTALPLIKKYDNVLIVRTFSKSMAFAGMRIGFAMGNSRLIKYMNDVKYSVNSYTMNRPAIELGVAVLSDEKYYVDAVAKVVRTREWTGKELRNRNFSVTDSKTNFVFAAPPADKISAKDLFTELKKRSIYVRWWDKDRLRDHLRISIGTDEEMQELITAIDAIIKEQGEK
ncbi:MAG: histidinol-phosphate transaminase [Lachnospiraceae bacterium]|nr:histidinol-phosphate transaminase [Lachnospiraceae bacterium]